MSNSSDTWKTGEQVAETSDYLCCICRQGGKSTVKRIEAGGIFPKCDVCGEKETTYQLRSAAGVR